MIEVELLNESQLLDDMKIDDPQSKEILFEGFHTGEGGGTMDHSKLNNLDYKHSGHIGFASEQALNNHLVAKNPHKITCEDIGAAPILSLQELKQKLTEHMTKENPHGITCEMIGAAPAKTAGIPEFKPTTPQEVDKGYIYVDNGGEKSKVSMNDMKQMNTKIASVDSETEANNKNLSTGDYIYIKE